MKIKEESINKFLEDVLLYPPRKSDGFGNGWQESLIGRFSTEKKDLLIKIGHLLDPGDEVTFEFKEYTSITGKEITGELVFKVETYDDISNKLVKVK